MDEQFPPGWADLKYPWIRKELLENLADLTIDDPLQLWAVQTRQGMCVGFDEVIHFFFDDHDFDEGDVGFSLFSNGEAQAIHTLKSALSQICDDLPEGNNEQSVSHPIWPEVQKLAGIAASLLRAS